MGGFERSVVIRRSIEEVAAYLSDLENDPQWRREWVDAESLTAGPVRAGTRTALVGEFLGRRLRTVYEVVAYEPHRLTFYLQDLAGLLHNYYFKHRVITEDASRTAAKLFLLKQVKTVVHGALRILGVSAPEKM